jgi:hypothetical protein
MKDLSIPSHQLEEVESREVFRRLPAMVGYSVTCLVSILGIYDQARVYKYNMIVGNHPSSTQSFDLKYDQFERLVIEYPSEDLQHALNDFIRHNGHGFGDNDKRIHHNVFGLDQCFLSHDEVWVTDDDADRRFKMLNGVLKDVNEDEDILGRRSSDYNRVTIKARHFVDPLTPSVGNELTWNVTVLANILRDVLNVDADTFIKARTDTLMKSTVKTERKDKVNDGIHGITSDGIPVDVSGHGFSLVILFMLGFANFSHWLRSVEGNALRSKRSKERVWHSYIDYDLGVLSGLEYYFKVFEPHQNDNRRLEMILEVWIPFVKRWRNYLNRQTSPDSERYLILNKVQKKNGSFNSSYLIDYLDNILS